METYQYNIIFCGENITVNRPKYVMDKSIEIPMDMSHVDNYHCTLSNETY